MIEQQIAQAQQAFGEKQRNEAICRAAHEQSIRALEYARGYMEALQVGQGYINDVMESLQEEKIANDKLMAELAQKEVTDDGGTD